MRRFLLSAVLGAWSGVVAGSVADAAPALPIDGVITNPDWVARPTGADMARYYPAIAAATGVSGQVILACEVAETGMVRNCRVEDEAPKGLEFGSAAVRLSPLFQMRPRTVDGTPVAGAKIRVPIRFTMNPPGAFSTNPLATGIDPRLLALATRLAEARGDRAEYLRRLAPGAEMLRRDLDNPLMPADVRQARTTLAKVMDEQLKASADGYVGLRAWEYARQFSEAELGGLVAFYESPLGKVWAQRSNDGSGERVLSQAFEQVRLAVGETFCRQAVCSLPGFSLGASASPRPGMPIDASP